MKALYEVIRSNKLDILSPLLHVTRLIWSLFSAVFLSCELKEKAFRFSLDGFEKKQIIDKKPDERSRSHIFWLTSSFFLSCVSSTIRIFPE